MALSVGRIHANFRGGHAQRRRLCPARASVCRHRRSGSRCGDGADYLSCCAGRWRQRAGGAWGRSTGVDGSLEISPWRRPAMGTAGLRRFHLGFVPAEGAGVVRIPAESTSRKRSGLGRAWPSWCMGLRLVSGSYRPEGSASSANVVGPRRRQRIHGLLGRTGSGLRWGPDTANQLPGCIP